MTSPVRPELPTASVGSSQAPTAAVDNSAPSAIRPDSTYKSGKAVQTNGATSDSGRWLTDGVGRLLTQSGPTAWHDGAPPIGWPRALDRFEHVASDN